MRASFAMWRKAVAAHPRIPAEEWHALDAVSRWLLSTRFSVILMTILAALIAGVLAFRFATISIAIWLVFLVAVVLAHATANILNDLIDFKLGLDRGNGFRGQYGPQPLDCGLRSERQQLLSATANGLLAAACGAVLVIYRDGMTLPLMLVGAFVILFYTFPLKRIALGEVSLLFVYGPLLVGGGYYVLTGAWSWSAVIAGLPLAVGIAASLVGKHIDTAEADRAKRIFSLPVIVGEKVARVIVIAMMILQFLIIAYLVLVNYFSPAVGLVLFALIYFFRTVVPVYARPRPLEKPARFPAAHWPLWFATPASRFSGLLGVLYLAGMVGDTALRLLGLW